MKTAAVIDGRQESNYPVFRQAKKMHDISLTRHKVAAIERTIVVARATAQEVLDKFYPHQSMLWFEATDKDKQPIIRNGQPLKLVTTQRIVVIKLREIAPMQVRQGKYQLPWVIMDGIYNKVADLLTSYAERLLDPHLAEKTSYPKVIKVVDGQEIAIDWPLVYQVNDSFKFFEHSETKTIYLYLPLFGESNAEELLSHVNPKTGPQLVRFGTDKINDMKLLKRGILIPLQFDKHAETTFIRDDRHQPGWKGRSFQAAARPRHQRYLEALNQEKDFLPKRVEVMIRGNRLVVNDACEIPTKPPYDVKHIMGVAFGLDDLIVVAMMNLKGKVIATHSVPAADYEKVYFQRLADLKAGGGKFHQELAAFVHDRLKLPIKKSVEFQCQVGILEVGNPNKGKYSPDFNRRLSFWPYGKCGTILEYKLEGEGAPKPHHWYASKANGRCFRCGTENELGQPKLVKPNGSDIYCSHCCKTTPTTLNAALNCAYFSYELWLKKK